MVVRETAATGFARFPHECQPGSHRAQTWLIKEFNLSFSGCLNETSQLTSGAWSWHKYGKAMDLGCWWYDSNDKADGDACFAYVLSHAGDFGLQQMIWGNKIVDVRDGYKVRFYSGLDHYNHIHIAMGYAASQNWQPPSATIPAPQPEVEMFRVIKGDQFADRWLTNWLERRHIGAKPGFDSAAKAERDAIIEAGVTDGAGEVTWPQAWVNAIPEKRSDA